MRTALMQVACGKAWREEERLGRATILAATGLELILTVRIEIGGRGPFIEAQI
jgi:hypothetical protein